MSLIFLWYLVTTPTDRIVCSLWTHEIPDRVALMQSCGFYEATGYRLDVVPLGGTSVVCSRDGDHLPVIEGDCHLPLPLDQYTVRIVKPKFSELVCAVTVEHEGLPTPAEVSDQCGTISEGVMMAFQGSRAKPSDAPPAVCVMPSLAAGFGLYDQAPDAASLWTADDLALLAGQMIWTGMVRPNCEGGRAGVDPYTLAADGCGMSAARRAVIAWQNRFNDDIFKAATTTRVPARLIKRIIKIESQYWPIWQDTSGESGMLQVSKNGVDVLLRYDPDLDPEYPRRPADSQYWKRLEVLQVLACAGCGVLDAVQHMHVTIPIYARLLAAYRCRAVEINPALSGAEAWRQAVIDYNGDQGYLRKVEG